MQIFNFCDGHVTTFWHPSGAYICQMPGQTCQISKRHTFGVSAFQWTHWFGVKLFPVGCAQDTGRVPLKCEKMLLAPPMLQNSGIFHDFTHPHLRSDGLPQKSRQSVVSV